MKPDPKSELRGLEEILNRESDDLRISRRREIAVVVLCLLVTLASAAAVGFALWKKWDYVAVSAFAASTSVLAVLHLTKKLR